MRNHTASVIFAVAAGALLTATGPALADPGKGKGPPPGKGPNVTQSVQTSRYDARLGRSERLIVRDYYSTRSNCPPGLAKKNNGCLPPGIAKKRYTVGRPLPSDVIVIELPRDLYGSLPPLPSGYGYRMVDGDLVVIALATMIIADAIGLY